MERGITFAQKPTMPIGKVFFVGAGPGDPELITLKGARLLQAADIVLTDRLVSEELLLHLVSPRAEVVFVGKEGGATLSTPQQSINSLLLEYSRRHQLVVRLKGGDVSLFSNILDELKTLITHNIPYEIIPGISAVSGAAAYAGLPLTARGYADGVRLLTYHSRKPKPEGYWRELAQTNDTLVFFMAGENLEPLIHQLQQHGITQGKGIAVIEQATTPYQQVHTATFENPGRLNQRAFVSPTLLIIGQVVNLQAQFGWLDNSTLEGSYFKSVAAINIQRA